MPGRLKTLELHGYKTFATKTLFEFANTITAIVGPNGSGKSNIADSIRWVLGEQSFSLLRARKTEDMIFSGSELRPKAGMASATMVFDNIDAWLPIDFSEVAITRRAYRDGENEYLINGQRVRLKDISELLGQSGLSERTYTIIGQGLVDAALSLKAEERRRLFEEAAGIGIYRSRREEALHRLDTTQRNLDRVKDILTELEPRMQSLERQARRALEYEHILDDLRILLRDWYGFHWHQSQMEIGEAKTAAQKREEQLNKLTYEQNELVTNITQVQGHVNDLRLQLNGWHKKMSELHAQQEQLLREKLVDNERQRSYLDQVQNLQAEASRLEEDLDTQRSRYDLASHDQKNKENELNEASQQADNAKAALEERQQARQKIEEINKNLQSGLINANSRLGTLQARAADFETQITSLLDRTETLNNDLNTASVQKNELGVQLDHTRKVLDTNDAEIRGLETGLETLRNSLKKSEQILGQLIRQRTELSVSIARIRAQLDVFDQAENSYSGYPDGASVLLKAAQQGQLNSTKGVFGSSIEVAVEFEVAITTVLGEYLDAVLLKSPDDVDAALDLLVKKSSRGIVLPLSEIRPASVTKISVDNECVFGVAADLIKVDDEYEDVAKLLLGRVIVVKDRETARRVLREVKQEEYLCLVTLNGEVFDARGPIKGGKEEKTSVITRSRIRRDLSTRLKNAETELASLETQISPVNAEIERIRLDIGEKQKTLDRVKTKQEKVNIDHRQNIAALEKATRRLEWCHQEIERNEAEVIQKKQNLKETKDGIEAVKQEVAKLTENVKTCQGELIALPLDEFQTAFTYWNTMIGVAQQAVKSASTRTYETEVSIAKTETAIEGLSVRRNQLELSVQELTSKQSQIDENEKLLNEQISLIQASIEPAQSQLQREEEHLNEIQGQEYSFRQTITNAEHNYSQAKVLLARRQESLENLRHKIEDDFGLVAFEYEESVAGQTPLPLQGLVEQLPKIKQLAPDLEDNIKHLRAQARRMGPINPEARAEYKEVKERYTFLIDQIHDLNKAEEDIRQVIAELDVMMEKAFRKTFNAVAEEFKDIFHRLFNGGSAKLLLTYPEDFNETGIDIEAKLPGRRTQGLSLLSGGERSLTATALVFSLLKVSPTPFCVLDEVDAMLDEANVGRFRDLLKELSQNTQFIIVTHNRNTVQVADVIYGITMGRDSATQVISLKLDEVDKIVQ